jgi:hypothetical protein
MVHSQEPNLASVLFLSVDSSSKFAGFSCKQVELSEGYLFVLNKEDVCTIFVSEQTSCAPLTLPSQALLFSSRGCTHVSASVERH